MIRILMSLSVESLLQTPFNSDSDSSELGEDSNELSCFRSQATDRKSLRKMTSLESVVAAVASMRGLPAVAGIPSLYPGN